MIEPHPIYIERGTKRAFACSLDWPGWARAGRDPDTAIETLIEWAPRYKATLGTATHGFRTPRDRTALDIVEKLKGDGTTDFGAPSAIAKRDLNPLDTRVSRRLTKLLQACWTTFDNAAEEAAGLELRKGPRGGGREVDGIVDHVREADAAYLSKLGGKRPKVASADRAEQMAALRATIVETLGILQRGEPAPRVPRSGTLWPPAYFIRRSAWHALDHVWEIEDRS